MEKWTKTFLKRLEQELRPYREDGYYLDAEGENPQMLRQLFETEQEPFLSVVMDMAVFIMEDESCLLQIYTLIEKDGECKAELLERINGLNLAIPLGAFGYFTEQKELYHKYALRIQEPENLEEFVYEMFDLVQIILNIVGNCYGELKQTTEAERSE